MLQRSVFFFLIPNVFFLLLVQIHVLKNVRMTRCCLRQYRHSKKVSLCIRPQSIASVSPHAVVAVCLYVYKINEVIGTGSTPYVPLKCFYVLNNFFYVKAYHDCCNVFPPDLQQKDASLKEKQHAISEMISEIQQKEMQKDDIIQKIEKLKEEQAKRKECKLIFGIYIFLITELYL